VPAMLIPSSASQRIGALAALAIRFGSSYRVGIMRPLGRIFRSYLESGALVLDYSVITSAKKQER
jgi:hypothetical protein